MRDYFKSIPEASAFLKHCLKCEERTSHKQAPLISDENEFFTVDMCQECGHSEIHKINDPDYQKRSRK